MRTGGRLAAAIEVLADIQTRHRPAADALKDWGLSHRFAGAGDRGAIGNIVYDALRRRRSAAHLLGADTPRALAFGALLLEWGETAAGLNASLEGDRFAPAPLDESELAAIAANPLDAAPDAVRADVPDWCAPLLRQAFGADWVEESRALSDRPPLDLRVNTLRADRERILRELAGMKAAPTRLAPHGIRIPPIEGSGRHPNVQAEPAFAKGWMEVQDEGSQVAARLAGAEPGMQVLDYCAGAGGKTLALSADMDNRGQLFAHDSEKQRLAPIFDRLRRSETRNVQVMSRADELAALEGRMDLVLVDAPCTGSGTWRRRPDAKWRLTERQLEVRMAEQDGILAAASRFVRPGGRLVYVTCSLFPLENAERLQRFLASNAAFTPVDHVALFETCFPGEGGSARIDPAGGISLSPARSGTDGFYVGVMVRRD
ncbi:RsmB/NOP family class I SAM-dependent RNA methyltransferase [Aquibium microcysteis]|uniref:RsmB/NOP family class I SAM-dependent RNA methyltransferase n=1 Tax=Aquibium microcysteis TaxID=675281 RepID=UPI00165D03E9|nr:RsmB/NOP family class I SAM-dependent RNA methyltransferase [Aquibium microcysteis]